MTTAIQKGTEIVPGYTLVRRLGSGMAGEVWVARASGGVYVAIKVIKDLEMLGSRRELGALRIVREVKHTNLCPLIGVWFFDKQGELLNNADTDAILGRESSLIDTACLHATMDPPKPGTEQDTQAFELGKTPGDNVIGSGVDEPDDDGPIDDSDLESGLRLTGPMPDPDFQSPAMEAMPKASQMVVAMGLGERTLHDRLVEMRAPDNQPDEDDPKQLPGGLPIDELMQYIAGAGAAIDELNIKHNIYHCDIKPQNILIVGGNAQVCDFGLARRVQDTRKTQLAIGTPAYGAPEMLFDQTYSKTIDQYSLAITYYELRTGKLPFETTRRSSFLRSKAMGELEFHHVPEAERVVIAKATSLEPTERYSTCGDFVNSLREALAANASPPNANSLGSKQLAVIAAVCVLLGIMALLATGKLPLFATTPIAKSQAEVQVGSGETSGEPAIEDLTVTLPESSDDSEPDADDTMSSGTSKLPEETSTSQEPAQPQPPPAKRLVADWSPDAATAEQLASAQSAWQIWREQPVSPLNPDEAESFVRAFARITPSLADNGEIRLAPWNDTTWEQHHSSLLELWQAVTDDLLAHPDLQDQSHRLASIRQQVDFAKLMSLLAVRSLTTPSKLADAVSEMRGAFDAQHQLSTTDSTVSGLASDASFAIVLAGVPAFNSGQVKNEDVNFFDSFQSDLHRAVVHNPRASGVSPSRASQLELWQAQWLCRTYRLGHSSKDTPNQRWLPAAVNVIDHIDWENWKTAGHPESLLPIARLVAGNFLWDFGRSKDATDQWRYLSKTISNQSSNASADLQESDLRRQAADRILPWLVDRSGVDDKSVDRLRYQSKLESFGLILDLVDRLIGQDPEYAAKLDLQQFLHAVAAGDEERASQLWNRRRLAPEDPAFSPQLGFALATLCLRRSQQQNDLTGEARFLADWLMGISKLPWPIDLQMRDREHRGYFDQHVHPLLTAIMRITPMPLGQLPVVSPEFSPDLLGKLGRQYLSIATRQTAPRNQQAFLDWLDEVEYAAVFAGTPCEQPSERAEYFLLGYEAFLQQRYEQVDDASPAELLNQLALYSQSADEFGDSAIADLLRGKLADQRGFQAHDIAERSQHYATARDAYSRVIDDPKRPGDLRGDALRCRASLLLRIASMPAANDLPALLNSAAEDAERSLELPPRWHLDHDERFAGSADALLAQAKMLPDLSPEQRQSLHDQSQQLMNQALLERKEQNLPTFQYAIRQLDRYLQDVIQNPVEVRVKRKLQLADDLINETATRPITADQIPLRLQPAKKRGLVKKLTHTIESDSVRMRCSWHSICGMVKMAGEQHDLANAHFTFAYELARSTLPATDDRRHLATLGLVRARSVILVEKDNSGQSPDTALIQELKSLLNEIEKPLPSYRAEKEQYLQALNAMLGN